MEAGHEFSQDCSSAMEDDRFEALKKYLSEMPVGHIADPRDLISYLAPCWGQFEGSNEEGMAAYKLWRMEDAAWNPPILEFTIERHGATAQGSTRASLQRWEVNVDCATVSCDANYGYRQVYQRQPPLNVRAIAEDLAAKIASGAADPSLHWMSSSRVRVRIGEVIPSKGPKQTVQDRRKRFRAALETLLRDYGWRPAGVNTYTKETNENPETG